MSKKEKVSPLNPVDMLETDDEIAEYLAETFLDDDPAVFVIALGNVAKARGMTNIAELTGLGRESMYKMLSGKSQPKWDSLHRIMKALGISLKVA